MRGAPPSAVRVTHRERGRGRAALPFAVMPVDARFHIHRAAENFNLGDLKRELARAGADPNRVNRYGPHPEYRGRTPLLILCRSWRYKSKEDDAVACAAALIKAGANVNFRSESHGMDHGATPLSLAAGGAMSRVVAMLIEAGADVTSTGRAALRNVLVPYLTDEPANRNAVRVVSTLIDAGVSVRGEKLDEILSVKYHRTDDRVLAHLLRAGAQVPHRMLRCAESRYLQGMPYLWNVSFAGYNTFAGLKFYEQRCLESLTAIFAPKFPQLPEELIPTIVRYAFHPGMYASSGVPTLTPAQVDRIYISLDVSPAAFSLDGPYPTAENTTSAAPSKKNAKKRRKKHRLALDAMFRLGVNREILTKFGSEYKWWVPPPPEHHGRQPFPHELKCALELHLSTVESLRRFHREEYRRERER